MKCPKCDSIEISGLIASFWVPLDEDGTPNGQWIDWESSTELGPECLCSNCGHEFDTDNEKGNSE